MFQLGGALLVALLTIPHNQENTFLNISFDSTFYISELTYLEEQESDELGFDFLGIGAVAFDLENEIEYCIINDDQKIEDETSSYVYYFTYNDNYEINYVIQNAIDDGFISGLYLDYLNKEGWFNIFCGFLGVYISPSYEIVPSDTENVGVQLTYDLTIVFNITIGNWFHVFNLTYNELDSLTIDLLTNFETYGAFNSYTYNNYMSWTNEINPIDYLNETYDGIYENGYNDGYDDGESDGYENGEEYGYEIGYADGEQDGYNKKYDFLQIISGAFDAVSNFFNMEIFPGVKFIYIIGIPIVIAVLRFVIGWFR